MIPTATYRLQFRNSMTFDRAAALVPYLKNLGTRTGDKPHTIDDRIKTVELIF
ncbi:glycosyl hydrolase [Salmonella enterica subsp. enterica serovar Typhi]|nr:glycosyl hydrolase [Salmonella enterica subsp. enterica serovar Typhi]